MSIFFKLFAGLVSTTAVVGSVVGIALNNKSETSIELDDDQSHPTRIVGNLTAYDDSHAPNWLKNKELDFTTNKYVCFLSDETEHTDENSTDKSEMVNCKIKPIIFTTSKSTIYEDDLKNLKDWNSTNYLISESQEWWVFEFDTEKLTNYQFKPQQPILIKFENKKIFTLNPLFEVQKNKIHTGKSNWLIVKTNNSSPITEFAHLNNSTYSCSFTSKSTNETNNLSKKCWLSFFSEEKIVKEKPNSSSFNFKNLKHNFDTGYQNKKIKKNQYYILKHELTNVQIDLTKPINYAQTKTNPNSTKKITTFHPVGRLFGSLKQSAKQNSKENIFVSIN